MTIANAPAKKKQTWMTRTRKSISRWSKGKLGVFQTWLATKSLVPGEEIIPNSALPFTKVLEDNWHVIRRELDAVMPSRSNLPSMQELSPIQYGIVKEDVWKVFVFRAFGTRSEENCHLCPETSRLLDSVPELETAFFSVLSPGAHLKAHHGLYKGLIRTHLGLMVPEPREKVRMRVGRAMIVWQEGKAVVFDDTYKHEVWNETDGTRVVLLIDTARPFPPILNKINKGLLRLARLSPEIGRILKRNKEWAKRYHAQA
jgi:beta-hydroxylase